MQTDCDIGFFWRTRDIQFDRGRLLPESECKRLNSRGRQGCPWRPRLKLDYHSHLHPTTELNVAVARLRQTGCRARQNETLDWDKTHVALQPGLLCDGLHRRRHQRVHAPTSSATGIILMMIAIGSSPLVSFSTE